MQKLIQSVLTAEAKAISSIPDQNPFEQCTELFLRTKARRASGERTHAERRTNAQRNS